MNNRRWTVLILILALFVPVLTGCNGSGGSSAPDDSQGSSTQTSDDSDTVNLFIIERNTNANILHYDAQLTKEGKLDPDQPVIAYWIMHAEQGQREELTWAERKMAYGFETKPASSGEGYIMNMVPLPKRKIRIRNTGETVQAQLKINGHPAVLEKIYVDADSGLTGPDVNYVKLFGHDLETGEKRTEKIKPD